MYWYLLLNPGILAVGSVGFLSMGMKISWTKASATMFTIYMTLSNVGHVIGHKAVGVLRDTLEFSYEGTFAAAGLAMITPLFLLFVVRPGEVDQAREPEKELDDVDAEIDSESDSSSEE